MHLRAFLDDKKCYIDGLSIVPFDIVNQIIYILRCIKKEESFCAFGAEY